MTTCVCLGLEYVYKKRAREKFIGGSGIGFSLVVLKVLSKPSIYLREGFLISTKVLVISVFLFIFRGNNLSRRYIY
jgi:hypothetical protein